MIAIQFKNSSGDTAVDFNAIIVEPDFDLPDKIEYPDINNVLRQSIGPVYKMWNIRFAYLPEADQDYLLALKYQAAPQFIHESTTYNIRIVGKPNVRSHGATITVVKTTPE